MNTYKPAYFLDKEMTPLVTEHAGDLLWDLAQIRNKAERKEISLGKLRENIERERRFLEEVGKHVKMLLKESEGEERISKEKIRDIYTVIKEIYG